MVAAYRESNLRRRAVRIAECPNHWELTDNYGLRENHPTAAEALRAVKACDAILAASGISVITVITWEPTTSMGQRVVRALQTSH